MLRRHCILSTCVTEKIQTAEDILTVDIPIRFSHSDPNEPSQIPIEFLLLKKSKVKQSFTQYEHFAQFVSQVKLDHLPHNPKNKVGFVALAESEEVGNQLIDQNIADVLMSNGEALLDLHITDQKVYNKYPLFMRARILIQADKQESALKCLKVCFAILDRVVKVKLSPQNKAKCEKVRRKADASKAKEKDEEKAMKVAMQQREEDKKYQDKLKTLPVADQ